jgi:arginase
VNIRVLAVPYDSGLRNVRMGRGPAHLLERGLVARLWDGGHDVAVETIEVADAPPAEIRTSFDVNRVLASAAREAAASGAFPLVLAGNCNTAVGTLAGLGSAEVAVVWFDAHGDFNTPETTISGFLDGMALAIVTGRCWSELARGVPGFRPIPPERVLLVGARDLDVAERAALDRSGMALVSAAALREHGASAALEAPLQRITAQTRRLYVHLDLDVLDAGEATANQFAAPGGLSVSDVADALRFLARQATIVGAAVTAYDPATDTGDRALEAGLGLLTLLAEAAGRIPPR